MIEQVSGKGVPQCVGRKVFFYTRFARVALDKVPEGLAAHSAPPASRKYHVGRMPTDQFRAPFDTVSVEPVERLLTQRHQAFFGPFADHAQHTLFQVDLRQAQGNELRHSQARGIKHFEHGSITESQRLPCMRC